MNKEQKHEILVTTLDNLDWYGYASITEFASNEDEGLMTQLKTTFEDDSEEFEGWLLKRLSEVLTEEELTAAMILQEEFEKVLSKLVELYYFFCETNEYFEIDIDEIWLNFCKRSYFKPITCIEDVLGKLTLSQVQIEIN